MDSVRNLIHNCCNVWTGETVSVIDALTRKTGLDAIEGGELRGRISTRIDQTIYYERRKVSFRKFSSEILKCLPCTTIGIRTDRRGVTFTTSADSDIEPRCAVQTGRESLSELADYTRTFSRTTLREVSS